MKVIIANVLSMLIVAYYGGTAFARQTGSPCKSPATYENRNQVDYGPLLIRRVSGRVIAKLGNSANSIGPVSRACLAIFTEPDHRLLAETVADEEGRFSFSAIPLGEYRLVVRADPLCVANVPLRIVAWPRGGFFKGRQLAIHMLPTGIDSCSYGNYK